MNKELLQKLGKAAVTQDQVLWASRDAYIDGVPFCKVPQSPHVRRRLIEKGIEVPSSHKIRCGMHTMFGTYDTMPWYE